MSNKVDNLNIEVGIDEVARGCLLGRVYSAAVIWRKTENLDKILKILNIQEESIKDSKKLNKLQRDNLKEYIENTALDYSIAWCDTPTIDKINIRNATFECMHKALKKLSIKPTKILVDGNCFKKYENIEHQCIIKGDSKITSISAASILAKVYHDNYILNLIENNPELKKYDLESNMGYGTKNHINAIKKFGISKYHRKTFGICKDYA